MRFIDTDPTLSEFSADQLRDMAVAVDMFIKDDKKALAAYRKRPALVSMFADKIEENTARIERLQIVYTQLVNAYARKEYLKRVASN